MAEVSATWSFPAPNTWGIHFDLYLKKVGARDATRDGELNGPTGMAFDGEDILYISDTYNHRIQVFTKDGRFLRNWGGFGSDEGKFNLPWHLTVDRENNVYVADWRNSAGAKVLPRRRLPCQLRRARLRRGRASPPVQRRRGQRRRRVCHRLGDPPVNRL